MIDLPDWNIGKNIKALVKKRTQSLLIKHPTLKVLKEMTQPETLCSYMEKQNKKKSKPTDIIHTAICSKPPWSRQSPWEAHQGQPFPRPCRSRCPNNRGRNGGWRFRRGARAGREAEWKSVLLWKLPPLSASTLCGLLCWFACRPSCGKGKRKKANGLSLLKRNVWNLKW